MHYGVFKWGGGGVMMITMFTHPFKQIYDAVKLKQLTRPYVHIKGALGDSHPSKGDGDNVRARLGGPVSAAICAVAFIFHHDLHAVLAALRVSDHGRHVSCTGSYRDRTDQSSTSGSAYDREE